MRHPNNDFFHLELKKNWPNSKHSLINFILPSFAFLLAIVGAKMSNRGRTLRSHFADHP